MPCYNEANRLPIDSILEFLKKNSDISILFVNDGSKDHTRSVIENFAPKLPLQISLIDLPTNIGKAEAVRQGMLYALLNFGPKLIGYWDADLATPLNELHAFNQHFHSHPNTLLVTGCRLKRLGVKVERKLMRHYLGRLFATTASSLLNLPVYDTQCGAKIFRADLAHQIFQEAFVSRWFFDVEIIFRIKSKKYNARKIVYEYPLLEWEDVAGSKIKFTDFLKVPFELLKIYMHYRR